MGKRLLRSFLDIIFNILIIFPLVASYMHIHFCFFHQVMVLATYHWYYYVKYTPQHCILLCIMLSWRLEELFKHYRFVFLKLTRFPFFFVVMNWFLHYVKLWNQLEIYHTCLRLAYLSSLFLLLLVFLCFLVELKVFISSNEGQCP